MAKVVVIGGYGPSLVRFRGPLIRSLVEAGHEVTCLAPEPEAPAGFDALGASYEPCAIERTGTRPDRDLRMLRRLTRQLRRLRPDVVFAYTIKPVTFGMMAARLAGVPRRFGMITGLGYLFIDDGSVKQKVVRSVALPLMRLGTSAASAIFVQNPDDERDLRAHHVVGRRQRMVRFWGSGVDTEAYPRRPLPEGPTTFLLVARLLRDKGVREFVTAAREVHRDHPDARFVLVGPPDPNPAGIPADEVEAWKAEGIVEVVGGTDDVLPYLEACHVFVLPSYREGTPRSVLEAMSTGRAIITTDAPGCRTTVEPGVNGFLVAPREAAPLAEAMRRYLEQPQLLVDHAEGSLGLIASRFDVRLVNGAMREAMAL